MQFANSARVCAHPQVVYRLIGLVEDLMTKVQNLVLYYGLGRVNEAGLRSRRVNSNLDGKGVPPRKAGSPPNFYGTLRSISVVESALYPPR